MSPQTATQPARESIQVKASATSDVFDRIQQTYDRSLAEHSRSLTIMASRSVTIWRIGSVPSPNCCIQDSLTVRAEVPGFNTKELEINVEPNRLTIVGKHEPQEEKKKSKTIYSEQCAKEILRVVYLPADVDSSKASATLKDGILNIELPKAAHAKTVRIEPKAV